jgi:hypothetical protein
VDAITTSYGGKRTSFHYKVKERYQIKTVFALTVDSAMSCMTKIQFIFRNRQFPPFCCLYLCYSFPILFSLTHTAAFYLLNLEG